MDLKRIIARNVLWNWAGMVLRVAVALVLTPFLVRHLGQTVYGLWILIGSLTSYFGVLDLGVGGSVGRYIAYYRAKGDQQGVNQTASTAVAVLCVPALLTLMGTVGAVALFFHLFEVPADQVDEVRLAILLVGLNLALTFPLSVFEGTLWGFQRFDLLNAIDIPAILLRTGLTLYYIGDGYGLVALAVINLVLTLATAGARLAATFRLDRGLRLGPRLVKLGLAKDLFGYGLWSMLMAVAAIFTAQMSPMIIGNQVGVELVAIYSIVLRLVDTARSFVVAGTGVLTPVATTLHARADHAQQRQLFLAGSRFCAVLAYYFLALFVFLGQPLLVLWVGPSLQDPSQVDIAFGLLVAFALGQVLPMSQWVSNSLILGMNRHRFMALVGVVESVAATALALALVRPYELMGVCVAFILGEVVCRGAIKLVYACRLVGEPVGQYMVRALLVPALPAAVPIGVLALGSLWWVPQTWPELFLEAGAFTLVYAAVCGVFLVGWEQVRAQAARFRDRLAGASRETPVTGDPKETSVETFCIH
jgi:O-antigen/teichoic acid export membrane protein